MDLKELINQYSGRKFGELILYHHSKHDLPTISKAFQGTIVELPPKVQPTIENWLDYISILGKNESFWQSDCGEIFGELCSKAKEWLSEFDNNPNETDIFNMVQLIILNFAYGTYKYPQSKYFIQKSIGIGLLRRILGI